MAVIWAIALAGMAGCSAPQDIAGGAAKATGGALTTAGQAGVQFLGNTSEVAAGFTRGVGETAVEATGGTEGAAKEVKKAGDDIAQKRKVDVLGNEVTIDPTQDKKIRMEF